MDFREIPDDIWISIFEQINDPSTLAILVRTCRRFHGLSSKLLLRDLKWIKPDLTLRNIEAWAGVYSTFVALPRMITIGIPFEFTHIMRQAAPSVHYPATLSAEMKLHDLIHTQLLRFTSISEICLDGTVISPYTYSVFGQIPTLRSLRLENCSFINLHVSFATRATNQPAQEAPSPLQIISMVPIKHLSLHRVIVPSEYENYRYHPLSLLTIPTLTSLSITWNSTFAARYAHNRWALSSLTDLSVVMPLMSRDLLDELAIFMHKCESSPRFKLKIDKHNLSDTQMATVQVPSTGLWNYEGPLVIVASSVTKSPRSTLTHVKINETLELPPLLDGLEKLPMALEDLEVQVGKWDIELLFATKELFKRIKTLVVRYVRGGLPENLLVRLGADILFCLPDLVSIKLLGPKLQEDGIVERSSAISGSGNGLLLGLGNGVASPHTSSLGHIHPHPPPSHVSVLHNVLVSGGLESGSEYNENYNLDFNADDFDVQHDEPRFGAGVNAIVPPHSTSSPGFPLSATPFRTYRPEFLSWNPGPSSRPSSEACTSTGSSSFPTNRSSASSSSRRAGFFANLKKQVRTERRHSPDKRESASPLSQSELGDYLIGWSRYCPSLRVVQIDNQWWWERRFPGDQWTLHVNKDNARNNDKGKEKEGSFFA